MPIDRLSNDFSFGHAGLTGTSFEHGLLLWLNIDLLAHSYCHRALLTTVDNIHHSIHHFFNNASSAAFSTVSSASTLPASTGTRSVGATPAPSRNSAPSGRT